MGVCMWVYVCPRREGTCYTARARGHTSDGYRALSVWRLCLGHLHVAARHLKAQCSKARRRHRVRNAPDTHTPPLRFKRTSAPRALTMRISASAEPPLPITRPMTSLEMGRTQVTSPGRPAPACGRKGGRRGGGGLYKDHVLRLAKEENEFPTAQHTCALPPRAGEAPNKVCVGI